MPTKAEQYAQMADQVARQLTGSWQEWAGFLTTAARLYKYPFHEQMMIYAQRPDATACAEYDLWNNRMGRYVRRGSKGIALVDDSGDRLRLRYVFDISDTGTREHSRTPWLWTMNEEHTAPVMAMLEGNYGVGGEELPQQLADVAAGLAEEYWTDHRQDILYIVDGSFLEEYDEYNIEVQFKSAAAVSITYALMSRCGLEPEQYFSHEDFMAIFDFNTPATVGALGTAVSQINQQVLRQIGVTIQNYERAKSAERSATHGEQPDLHEERRLPDPRPEAVRTAGEAPGQVRQDAQGVPERTPAHPLQPAADEREAVPAPSGDRRDREQPSGADDAAAGRGSGRDGGTESPRSDGLGGPDEHLQSPGRGDSAGGTYQQLTLNLFLSEAEQIHKIDEAESVKTPSAFSMPKPAAQAEPVRRALTQAEIDAAIQEWNGNIESKHAVVRYMKDHAREKDTAAWLRQEYGDDLPALPVTVDGAAGDVPWPKVQRRIAQLIKEDRFYTEAEQDRFDNIDPIAIREALAERGIVNGQVVDPEKLDNDPFIQQVMRDVEAVAAEEQTEAAAKPSVPDLSGRPIAREGDTLTIGSGEPTHEIDITVSDEEYAAIRGTIPERTAYDPSAPVYNVGDTVYLDDRAHQITELREDTVQLLPTGMSYPIYRVESRERFEQLLRADNRNDFYTEFLPVNPDTADQDLRDVLAHGLIGAPNKAELSELLRTGKSNREVALWLSRAYPDIIETMELETGDTADYRTIPEGIELEVLDADEKRLAMLFFRWDEVAPLLRGLYARQLDGFVQEQDEPYMEAPAAVEEPAETAKPIEEAAEAPAFHSETVAVYPGDKNGLPYDVVVERLHVDRPEPTPPEPTPDTQPEEKPDHPVAIPVNGEWQTFPNQRAAEQAAYQEYRDNLRRNAENFRITDDHLGEGGPKAKYQANVAAIKLLKYLEETTGQATPEQQEVLSRYVGWGGVADAFDPDKPAWDAEYSELKELLTPEKYAAARASTLNAHYTSPTVIRAIYEAVEQMGFRTGNILEPSCGVGNFFGMLPESMAGSRLYGVELDSISGRIAQQLYPKANITVAGFETTDRRDFYDLAIGNVPFGQYQVNDKAYNKLGFNIHNYFFAKALDQVRPGGVVAFVTSRYTMDAKDSTVRRYLAQRAELLGAIRLPNNAFRANAGTDVVSDILFLQKRDRPLDIAPDWTQTGRTEEGFTVNQYFLDHPEMVLGRPTAESTQYGKQDYTVAPIEGLELADQLHDAVKYIRGTYQEAALPELGEGEDIDESLPADPNVKNYSYTVVDGAVYFRENSRMVRPDLNATAEARVKGLVGLRDCVQRLIDLEMDAAAPDADIRAQIAELNRRYDDFSAKYGLINDRANRLAFADDSSYYLLCALEVLDEDGRLERKADMFTKRTIKPHEAVTTVDTASEALAVSISEKACVDMAYMEQLTGKTGEELADELRGVIFRVPGQTEPDGTPHYVTADEYLSGNVRRKLRQAQRAAEQDPAFAVNVEALTAAQPKDLDASEIEVRLGATWIDKEYIQQFMYETFDTPFYLQRSIEVHYTPFTAEWQISGKNVVGQNNVAAYSTYGTSRANAYKILEDSLNLRDVRIYDTVEDADGKERRVLNAKETTLAAQKQQAIRDAFRDWIWRDPERRQALVRQYNEEMNATRPREYDGSHIVFGGMNPAITLREHQKNAIAHVLYGGNTLLAHEVGAGKTFEMVGAAMEAKRLGLCQKSLFVVPNHLTEQWASEFLRLYPSANILVTTKKDFEKHNRKKFCARIATGDYDAIIMGHSQFEKIPISKERQERLLHEQIWEITEGIAEVEASGGERFTVKQLERTKKSLEARLEKLQAEDRKDDVVTFEQLGVDRLFVDEAHNYKNLFLYTKMRNVAGLSTTDAQKSSDMFAKCRYMDEITGGRGVVFATGTPVSNSMTELYTMQRYLQYDRLQELGMAHFDCWASRFGETVTALELAPEGTGYRARTRFSKFFNLPELMNLFKEVADIKTADQLHLPTPEVEYHNIVAQPTEQQQEMVKALSERASLVHSGTVDPSQDNMLKITSDGRKLGLDQRIINQLLPDEPGTKVNQCVDNIMQIWRDGEADKLTQLVFCDISTPQARPAKKVAKALDNPTLHALEDAVPLDEPEPAFTVYEDIRQKLIAKGVPAEQIAFIHEANTEVRKKELFSKVRTGQVRVLLGSTAKMGAGTNVQDRLVALHDLDCPWRPGDLAQRKGRIERQGNQNETVHVYRYVTEGTFDAYLWQTVENKQKFISQIMTSKSPVRSCDDVDETALSFAEIKALCAGDPRIKERMDLDVDVARLKLMKADHQSKQYRLEDQLLKTFPEEIEKNKGFIAGLEADMATLAAHPHPEDGFAGMEVRGDTLTDKENAGAALLDACKEVKGADPVPVGSYRGFTMSVSFDAFRQEYMLLLKGQMTHRATLGTDPRGNLTRIDNALSQMPQRLEAVKNQLDNLYQQQAAAKAEVGKPFPQEQELRDKSARLAELDVLLNMDGRGRRAAPKRNPNTTNRRCDNMNTDKNTALYEKMAAEQDKFRDWLKSQPPEEILKQTYEYTVREDILMAMEELDLPQSRAAALLASSSPLADVYKEFSDRETSYMDVVRDSIEQRADAALDAQRELPLYRHDAAYAREQGDLDLYRASRRANIACKEAIEAAISEHYRDNRLDKDAVPQVIEQFGYTRILYVLANTVQQKEWDERFSPANKAWARTVDIPPNPDGFGGERNLDFVVDSHSGLVDLFLSQARQDYLRLQPLTPEEIRAEAARLLQELRAPGTPNSPHGTHYMARVSPDFLARAGTQAHDQLMTLLPFRSLAITGMKELPGTYVTILASEDRSKELRQRRPSVRRQLKQEPRPAEKPEKKSPIYKKKEPER